MFLDFNQIFSADYLFNLNPGPLLPTFNKILITFFATLVIAALVARRFAAREIPAPIEKFFAKTYHAGLTLGILGLLYVFFRQQNIFFFGAAFWIFLWILGAIIWAGFILKYYLADRPTQLVALQEKKEKDKYLPRPSKH